MLMVQCFFFWNASVVMFNILFQLYQVQDGIEIKVYHACSGLCACAVYLLLYIQCTYLLVNVANRKFK